jgi:beta-1,3-galactosyltransferase 1
MAITLSDSAILSFVLIVATVPLISCGDDFTTLKPSDYSAPVGIRPSEIRFIRNVIEVCADQQEPPVVVVVVCSSVGNFRRRDVIRQTWANRQVSGLRVVFMLGRPPTDTANADAVESAVDDEWRRWGDVIQADFVDTYANLTRKSIAALRWVSMNARCAGHVLKSDDDTFVNTPLLVADLRTTTHRKFVMGNAIAAARPVREPDQKWHTPESAYRRAIYPTYASGAAYVVSGDAVDAMLDASATTPFFWIEDVYITGMLARTAGVQLIVNGKFDGYRDLADACAVRRHIVLHRIVDDRMRKLWKVVADDDAKCSGKSVR